MERFLPHQLLIILYMCEGAVASAMSMSRPLPEMDAWFFIAKYIRPEWFQWTLTVVIFLAFVILSQLSCLRPADINKFDKTMKPHGKIGGGAKAAAGIKKAPLAAKVSPAAKKA